MAVLCQLCKIIRLTENYVKKDGPVCPSCMGEYPYLGCY